MCFFTDKKCGIDFVRLIKSFIFNYLTLIFICIIPSVCLGVESKGPFFLANRKRRKTILYFRDFTRTC